MSKPLLFEYWVNSGRPLELPEGQGDVERRWKAEIMFRDDNNDLSEFTIDVDRKLKLTELLDVLMQQLSSLDRGGRTILDCGFKAW